MPNTTNHNVPLPTVGASADTWGGENNNAHQAWDTLTSGAQNTILGRVASGSGPMKQLTATEATSALVPVVGDSGGGGSKGLVPAPSAGDAAQGKALLASGVWGYAGPNAIGRFNGSTGAATAARGLSVAKTSTGVYSVTISPVMANTNYMIIASAERAILTSEMPAIDAKTANGFILSFRTFVPGSNDFSPFDPDFFSVSVQAI